MSILSIFSTPCNTLPRREQKAQVLQKAISFLLDYFESMSECQKSNHFFVEIETSQKVKKCLFI